MNLYLQNLAEIIIKSKYFEQYLLFLIWMKKIIKLRFKMGCKICHFCKVYPILPKNPHNSQFKDIFLHLAVSLSSY